jgi:hypothetical protein
MRGTHDSADPGEDQRDMQPSVLSILLEVS